MKVILTKRISAILTLFGSFLGAAITAHAGPVAPVAPGANVPLSGTTAIESPTTAGFVIRDELIPFEVRNPVDEVILTGILQDRVVRNSDGDTVFAPRLRDLANPPGQFGWVIGVRVSGYSGVAVNAEYKLDGSGDVGPQSVTRTAGTGDQLFFSHGSALINPPDEQRFLTIVTDELEYSLAGRFEIFVSNDFGGPVHSTLIENTAAPTPFYQVDPNDSIQAAIDAASPGDRIYVAAGTYNENIVLREGIDVIGADPCTTIINGGGSGSVVTLTNLIDTEFAGFTVSGSGSGNGDSGIRIQGGRPSVNNNKITGNNDGIYTVSSDALVCGNRMFDNTSAGIHLVKSSPLVTGCFVYRNDVGILAEDTGSNDAQFVNNTVDDNDGDGIRFEFCNPVVFNTISSNNGGAGIRATGAAPPLSYNNFWSNSPNYVGAAPGTGSFSADPLFYTTVADDYALLGGSPCIDTGAPAPAFFDLDGTRADIGATGGACGTSAIPEELPIHSGFIFTSVGRIPTSAIGNTFDGLAEFGSFHDAPFGGTLWLYGGFGHVDSSITEYSIHIGEWDGSTPPEAGDFIAVDDPLSKARWDFIGGSYVPGRVPVGPETVGGIPFYDRTVNGGGVIWGHENVMVKLDTSGFDGTYDIQLRAYDATRTQVPLIDNTLTLTIDNSEPVADLLSISRSDGTPIPECAIIRLADETENLRFRFNASHPGGHLHSYKLDALVGRDRHAGVLASDQYLGGHDSPGPIWNGVTGELLTTRPAADWEQCAYQFRLTATARTTNGFSRIYQDESFINYAIDPLTGLCTPDLDGDGDVDGDDLAIFAAAYGSN